jgi:RND family efflux transporter MFP subunit
VSSPSRSLSLVLFLLAGALAGCEQTPAPAMPNPAQVPPPEVLVSVPVSKDVTDYEDFPGRTEAIVSVDIRARVTGYLEQVHFKEGTYVKQNELLFEIDPRPYQAELARTEGNLKQAEGHLNRLESDFLRARALLGSRAIGKEEYDKINGDHTEAMGAVETARASRDLAKLNLSYCRVTAPIAGRISRRYIDPGNMVKADDTILTTLVTVDPIYATFDVDERTTLRLQRLAREGKMKWSLDQSLPVFMGLADEEGFSQEGTINFADNRVDPDTGTWRLRGRFANPQGILSPGLFVRIRLPIGGAYRATLIAEEALSTDQGQKFVYVVGEGNKVSYRRVDVGRLHDGLRVVTKGLKADEKVVVSGLQRIRQDAVVKPKLVRMPVGGAPPEEVAEADGASKEADKPEQAKSPPSGKAEAR